MGSRLHWAPACPEATDSGSRGVGRGGPGPDFPGQVRSQQVALQPHLSPEILLPESIRFSHFSPPQGLHFSSGYHHLLSTESFADLPASGLVWIFCATGSRKPSLGCLAARKQWQSSEGQAWALWVTLGASGGSSAPLCLCPPAPTPGLSPGGAVGAPESTSAPAQSPQSSQRGPGRQSQHSLSASQVPAPLNKPHPHPTRPMWAHLTVLPVQTRPL